MDNFTPEMNEKLVLYLDGTLTGAEKIELEQQLAADTSLREELHNLQLAREAIRYYGMKQRVSAIHQEAMKERQAPIRKISERKRIIRYSLAIAASILLIYIGIATYNDYTISAHSVYAANYHTYELATLRDGRPETAIAKAYRAKEYEKVVELSQGSADREAIFLAAMAYIELKKPASAIFNLEEILGMSFSSGDNTYKDEAEYYLSLIFINNKAYELALPLLEKIQSDPLHLYHDKVTDKLIRQVKRLQSK